MVWINFLKTWDIVYKWYDQNNNNNSNLFYRLSRPPHNLRKLIVKNGDFFTLFCKNKKKIKTEISGKFVHWVMPRCYGDLMLRIKINQGKRRLRWWAENDGSHVIFKLQMLKIEMTWCRNQPSIPTISTYSPFCDILIKRSKPQFFLFTKF